MRERKSTQIHTLAGEKNDTHCVYYAKFAGEKFLGASVNTYEKSNCGLRVQAAILTSTTKKNNNGAREEKNQHNNNAKPRIERATRI